MNASLSLPPPQHYRPATFQERGVAVPFTTPILAGVRARHGQRGEIELVVPNPSGGSGVYIVPSRGLRSLCRLTVHDARLNQRVAELADLTPSAVRQAILDVAAQGLAGREARDAAATAIARDRHDRDMVRYLLAGLLAEQGAPAEFSVPGWQLNRSPALEQLAERAGLRAAAARGQSRQQVALALDGLAGLFAAIGVTGQPEPARVLRLIGRMASLREQLGAWVLEHCEDTQTELADTIADAARQIIAAAEPMLVAAHGMTKDVLALLHGWSRSRARIAEVTGRAEWLLDGWEQICLLWQASRAPDQQWAVMAELVHLIPVQPREIADWCGGTAASLTEAAPYAVSLDATRRSDGAAPGLTARNERMRALL
ncbi:MAG: hypothetical protein WDN25_24465 [Acetobacteraceae bacterium]